MLHAVGWIEPGLAHQEFCQGLEYYHLTVVLVIFLNNLVNNLATHRVDVQHQIFIISIIIIGSAFVFFGFIFHKSLEQHLKPKYFCRFKVGDFTPVSHLDPPFTVASERSKISKSLMDPVEHICIVMILLPVLRLLQLKKVEISRLQNEQQSVYLGASFCFFNFVL